LAKLASHAISDLSRRSIEMPTRNISLTPEQDAFVEEVVRKGEYRSASEAMRDALRVLQQRRSEEAEKLKVLQKLVKEGIDDLEAGRFREVADSELEGYFEELMSLAAAKARR
jgi:antitoxin ParD1/3/4